MPYNPPTLWSWVPGRDYRHRRSSTRFPNQLAAEIAVRTVKDYLTVHPDCSVRQVVFNVFKEVDRNIYQRLLLS